MKSCCPHPLPKNQLLPEAGHIKAGQSDVSFGRFDLSGLVLGCFFGRPVCASKQGLQAPGSELLGQSLKIPRTEKCPKTGDADDWVYCDWVEVWPIFSVREKQDLACPPQKILEKEGKIIK